MGSNFVREQQCKLGKEKDSDPERRKTRANCDEATCSDSAFRIDSFWSPQEPGYNRPSQESVSKHKLHKSSHGISQLTRLMESEVLWLEQQLQDVQREADKVPALRFEATLREDYIEQLHSEYLTQQQRHRDLQCRMQKTYESAGTQTLDQGNVSNPAITTTTDATGELPVIDTTIAKLTVKDKHQHQPSHQQQDRLKQEQTEHSEQLRTKLRRQSALIVNLSQSLSRVLKLMDAQSHAIRSQAQRLEALEGELVEFLLLSAVD